MPEHYNANGMLYYKFRNNEFLGQMYARMENRQCIYIIWLKLLKANIPSWSTIFEWSHLRYNQQFICSQLYERRNYCIQNKHNKALSSMWCKHGVYKELAFIAMKNAQEFIKYLWVVRRLVL